MRFLQIAIIKFVLFVFVCASGIEVTLPDGKICGREAKTIDNFPFYAFQQIPYAAPPIGKLRFKAPIPPEKWNATLNTTRNTKICFQWGRPKKEASEDCLFLNVYTPVIPGSIATVPVLVFIHGGAFSFDSSSYDNYGPDFMIDKGIVIVTLNYRLGPFGFLSTGDNIIPGNNGLKDQHLALKWVNMNIHLFGGDASKITLMGQSAGSASVAYHILSKKSKGLFRASICQSGTAISSFAYQKYAKKIAYQLGAALDSDFTNDKSSEELLEILQKADAHAINTANIAGLNGIRIGKGDIFAPVIEPKGNAAFITKSMHESFSNGDFNQVPLLIGVNSLELIKLARDLNKLKSYMAIFDEDIKQIVKEDFNIKVRRNNAAVGKLIREMYTEGKFQDDLPASIEFHSDVRFTTSVIRHAHLQSKYTPVYFYMFSYDGEIGGVNAHIDDFTGVAHTENNRYIWRIKGRGYNNSDLSQFPEKDVLTVKRFVQIITDFVKFSNPTPEASTLLQNITWPVVATDNIQYVNIGEDIEILLHPKKYKHWKYLYDTYGHPPFVSY